MRVIATMSVPYVAPVAVSNDQVVGRPRRTDAIGMTLRGAYGSAIALPADLILLLQRLDRSR